MHCNLGKINFLPVVFRDFGGWKVISEFLYIANDGIKTLKRLYLKKRLLGYSFTS